MASNRWFRNLQTTFYAMLLAQLIFAVVTWFSIQGRPIQYVFGEGLDLSLFAGYTVLMVGGAIFIDGFRRRFVRRHGLLRGSAAGSYRSTVFIRTAILLGATLLLTGIAYLTNNVQPLGLVVLLLIVFYFYRPTEEEFIRRYG